MLKNTLFLFAFFLSALGVNAQMTGMSQLEQQGSNQAGGCTGVTATFNLNVDNLVNTGNGDVIVQITALQGGTLIESISMSNDMTMDYPVCVDPGCYRAKIVANGANTGFICTLSIPGQDPIEMTYNSQNISFGTDLCITGCTQFDACNYNPDANISDYASCVFEEDGFDCDGNCLGDPIDVATLALNSPFEFFPADCEDFTALTTEALGIAGFSSTSNEIVGLEDDGFGQYVPIGEGVSYTITEGCLVDLSAFGLPPFMWNAANNSLESVMPDPFEVYYYGATCVVGNSLATVIEGCTDETACNFDPTATGDDGSCEFTSCAGCMFELACNYDATATIMDHTVCDFESCVGCTYPDAENYNDMASIDDGSCTYVDNVTCMGDFNNDGAINSGDLLVFLGVFGGTCEEN